MGACGFYLFPHFVFTAGWARLLRLPAAFARRFVERVDVVARAFAIPILEVEHEVGMHFEPFTVRVEDVFRPGRHAVAHVNLPEKLAW